MGAWETNGYGKVVDPFWDNKEKSSGGGGSDIPTPPDRRGYFLKTAQGDQGIELEWEKFNDNVKEIMYPMFAAGDEYVGKVFTKYGTGANDNGWVNAQASYTDYSNTSSGLNASTVQDAIDELASSSGGSETLLFDDVVLVDSQATGAGWAEIPSADRVELFDSNNLLKFHRIHMEVSFVKKLVADVRTEVENFSCDFDLDRILVADAQDYSDPEYSSERDNNVQAYAYHAYLVNSGGSYAENIIEVNLNFNMFGTNPSPEVNTFAGRLLGLYFENRLVSSGAYNALPGSEQAIRVKITAK